MRWGEKESEWVRVFADHSSDLGLVSIFSTSPEVSTLSHTERLFWIQWCQHHTHGLNDVMGYHEFLHIPPPTSWLILWLSDLLLLCCEWLSQCVRHCTLLIRYNSAWQVSGATAVMEKGWLTDSDYNHTRAVPYRIIEEDAHFVYVFLFCFCFFLLICCLCFCARRWLLFCCLSLCVLVCVWVSMCVWSSVMTGSSCLQRHSYTHAILKQPLPPHPLDIGVGGPVVSIIYIFI